jgi:hypothetical protein
MFLEIFKNIFVYISNEEKKKKNKKTKRTKP